MSTEGRRTALSLPMFEYAGGRSIYRDGKPFATIGRPVDAKTGAGPDAVDVDAFARTLPALLEAAQHVALADPTALPLQARQAFGEVREALRLLDWRYPDQAARFFRFDGCSGGNRKCDRCGHEWTRHLCPGSRCPR